MTTEQIISIIANLDLYAYFVDNLDTGDDTITYSTALQDFYTDTVLSDYEDTDEERIFALMEHTEDSFDTCSTYFNNDDWLVLTDDEADDKWDEHLDNYLEECVLPELPETMSMHFDKESWMSDAKVDGRGHSLSSYDGEEHSETVNDTEYYLYRVN